MSVVAVLGLGEAGSAIAADLLAGGADVRGYDPALPAPDGVCGCRDEADAARTAALVLSVNSAEAAADALRVGLAGCSPDTVWADLNTATPELEQRLGHAAGHAGVGFADVALMAPVPGRGIRTPMLVSGSAATRFADLVKPFGARVEVLAAPSGEASRRKLLRSVFFKGMAAAVTEALAASAQLGLEEWMRDLVADELEAADGSFAQRLEEGSVRHAVRRTEEMTAAAAMLDELGVPPRVATASRDWLADLARGGE